MSGLKLVKKRTWVLQWGGRIRLRPNQCPKAHSPPTPRKGRLGLPRGTTCPHSLQCPSPLLQTRGAPENCEFFTISGSQRVLLSVSNVVITTEEWATVCKPLSVAKSVLVKMVSPSPAEHEDKVPGEEGGHFSQGGPSWALLASQQGN